VVQSKAQEQKEEKKCESHQNFCSHVIVGDKGIPKNIKKGGLKDWLIGFTSSVSQIVLGVRNLLYQIDRIFTQSLFE